MSGQINQDRRVFLRNSVATLAAAEFGIVASAFAQGGGSKKDPAPAKSLGNTTFASLKQINAGVLNIGYAEDGPANGPAEIGRAHV